MKILLTTFLALLTITGFAQENTPIYPFEISAILKPILPTGWRCSADNNGIVITRDEQVTLLNLASLPPGGLGRLANQFGKKTDYMIILAFRPRLSDKQIDGLKALQADAVSAVRPTDDPKHSRSTLEAEKYVLPNYYNSRFSIYMTRTDDGMTKIFPVSAENERDTILAALSKMIEKQPQQGGPGYPPQGVGSPDP